MPMPWRHTTDVEDIKFVINYDYPNSSEDYVHRIGRTARSQRTGTAYTFFTPNNSKQAGDLVNVLREANQDVNPRLLQLADSARGMRGGKLSRVLIMPNNLHQNKAQPTCTKV